MNRSKQAANRVSVLAKRIWEQCLKEVEEEMRLEASKRMRLIPNGNGMSGLVAHNLKPELLPNCLEVHRMRNHQRITIMHIDTW
ncbi:uncharacterized protein LOC125763762 isoform X3 [Anopheles funestus]|uniref:uncharacterized protein LOC125763762 isoform X3 n=1 Tax=Anopheles funestus TaxID=62324 RepID=UPI0020C5F4B6|nr:uncharacterized protein LOC125763762 isoform X3 [Anopheles funestus]